MMRVADDAMEPRYRAGNWLGLVRCRRPAKGRDVVFVDDAGNMVMGEVRGVSADGWRVGQFRGEPRYTVRRLSRTRWRPAWRVVAAHFRADDFYQALALGLHDRATAILAAERGLGPTPAPLSDAEREAVPRVVKVAHR
jgi:hypothetical protein